MKISPQICIWIIRVYYSYIAWLILLSNLLAKLLRKSSWFHWWYLIPAYLQRSWCCVIPEDNINLVRAFLKSRPHWDWEESCAWDLGEDSTVRVRKMSGLRWSWFWWWCPQLLMWGPSHLGQSLGVAWWVLTSCCERPPGDCCSCQFLQCLIHSDVQNNGGTSN